MLYWLLYGEIGLLVRNLFLIDETFHRYQQQRKINRPNECIQWEGYMIPDVCPFVPKKGHYFCISVYINDNTPSLYIIAIFNCFSQTFINRCPTSWILITIKEVLDCFRSVCVILSSFHDNVKSDRVFTQYTNRLPSKGRSYNCTFHFVRSGCLTWYTPY